jgi:hypothetical protein
VSKTLEFWSCLTGGSEYGYWKYVSFTETSRITETFRSLVAGKQVGCYLSRDVTRLHAGLDIHTGGREPSSGKVSNRGNFALRTSVLRISSLHGRV